MSGTIWRRQETKGLLGLIEEPFSFTLKSETRDTNPCNMGNGFILYRIIRNVAPLKSRTWYNATNSSPTKEEGLLLELNVRNLGIIENTNWQLSSGLNIITGETGTGKSLVIDAVEALLGGRTGEETIRHGSDEAIIEGIFSLPETKTSLTIAAILEEKGIPLEHETFIVTCVIRRPGRAVFRINSHAVPRNVVHQIGRLLIDIHGQSEHLALLDKKYHLDFLDAFGGVEELRNKFTAKLARLHETEKELHTLSHQVSDQARREDFLRFQIDEIQAANLQNGEEEELAQERQILTSTEKLKALSYEVYKSITGDGSHFSSTLDQLRQAGNNLCELGALEPKMAQQASSLEATIYEIEEITRDIRFYADDLEYDPARLAEVELRLDLIRNLKRKYGDSVTEILASLEAAETELEGLSSSTERQAELEARCIAVKVEMGQIASELSKERKRTAEQLVAAVTRELSDLNMKQMMFEIDVVPIQGNETIPLPSGEEHAFGSDGIDLVEFVAATNPGEPTKPLAKIASTGEISRFMLALKGALAQVDDIPVVIFDEIDIGVGGRSSEILGKKLWVLGRGRQVICITHLPQIAIFADTHFGVHKEFADERTSSILKKLDGESRLRELAAMLAGPEFSKTAMANAGELMESAKSAKDNFK